MATVTLKIQSDHVPNWFSHLFQVAKLRGVSITSLAKQLGCSRTLLYEYQPKPEGTNYTIQSEDIWGYYYLLKDSGWRELKPPNLPTMEELEILFNKHGLNNDSTLK